MNSYPVVLLALALMTPAAMAAKRGPSDAPEAETRPTPLAAAPGRAIRVFPSLRPQLKSHGVRANDDLTVTPPGPIPFGPPSELKLTHAGSSRIDLRNLPLTPPKKRKRPELEPPPVTPTVVQNALTPPSGSTPSVPTASAPAPAPVANFAGLDYNNWGSGWPPDTNGDVGPNYFIQTVNASIGVYSKATGARVAAFTFDTLMSQGHFGNLCDIANFGDPVVLYDSFEDRWIITDFAFELDNYDNVANPPGNFQCIAASMTGDPVSGGWNFYSINTAGGLGDYPKFGIWPDGLYMSTNMFQYGGSYMNSRMYAFNKAQMYAGKPSVQVVTFDAPAADFSFLPANARLQNGTPPAGSPNYYGVVWQYTNAVSIYEFHVNWSAVSTSAVTGPFLTLAPANWVSPPGTAPTLGGSNLDTLGVRLMAQNQYANQGGVESIWLSHTVKGNASGTAAPRYYQVDVTGGNVAPATTQAFTFTPDSTMNRFLPSVSVDRAGDMAMGYSTANSSTYPAIKYAGRLATDPVNSLPQTETLLIQGTGSQDYSIFRWGDYSAMTLDPDGCTFWYTSEYYNAADPFDWLTRIGSFAFPSCIPLGAGGTLQGKVTAAVGGTLLAGATVSFGARSAITNGSGLYSFSGIPAGTYPSVKAGTPGYISQTATTIVIADAAMTTDDFALTAAAANGCLADTTQLDFQSGVPTSVDLVTSPGDVILSSAATIDQQNLNTSFRGALFTSTSWAGQTFTPAVTGHLVRADVDLSCSGCSRTTPNPDITISIRATTGNPAVPTGPDLATATIPGFMSGTSGFFTANFATPPTLSAGTRYAFIVRPVANPTTGNYSYLCSCVYPDSNAYANGQIVSSTDSGTTWTADTTAGGRDLGFTTYMQSGFAASGNLVSGLKDSNPATGLTPIWSTLSWTAATPANTSVKFQLAGSNSDSGPFSFVGPDGTAATFFTSSGASISQFYGKRYLQYKAYLASTSNAATPALSDVSLCFADTDCSAPPVITPSPAQVCPSSTGNTAMGPAGATSYAWSISNGTITGGASSQTVTYTAGPSGSAGLTLSILAANGCHQSGSVNVPIGLPSAPTITPGGPTTFCPGNNVSLRSSSATGNQWYLNGNPIGGATAQTYIATASGNYTVTLTTGGCTSLPSAATTVTVLPLPPTPTITPGGSTAFCTGGSVTLTSSSATGNQWYLNGSLIGGATSQAYVASTAGGYTLVVTSGSCSSLTSATMTVTISATAAVPTITPNGPTTFCAGGSVTLTSSSNGDNQWYLNSNPINGATNQAYVATAAGDYSVTVTASACSPSSSAVTTVTVLPLPPTPTITPGGPTTFCAGGSVTLTSSSASNNQWYLNGTSIGGATNQSYVASASGNYTVTVTGGGCTSLPSAATTVTVNPIPAAPAITPGGPTTFCTGGSVTLSSSSASGNQWFLNGNSIGGATNQTYIANASGSYTVTLTSLGCTSAPSAPVSVTVNPIPATPTVSGGPTSFCAGGSVTLTSSSATGNQWFSNGSPIGGATGQTYLASVAADYTVKVTTSGCTSAPSSATTVTVNPLPSAAISAPTTVVTGTSAGASVANAGTGATYVWGITNGSITAGAGTAGITFTAGAIGTLTLNVTVTTAANCSDAKTASITVKSAAPDPTITSIVPSAGRITGGAPITINGTGFQSGATVTIGGNAATSVVFVSSVKLTARTPAHAAGLVSVKINNLDTTTSTTNNAFTYLAQQFDANGDGAIDPSDIFYLVNYLFTHGPAPRGAAGMLSGDANGDGNVDPADIFYIVNRLFTGGPQPFWTPVTPLTATWSAQSLAGALSLGQPLTRGGRTYVPIILTLAPDSPAPQAISLKLLFESAAGGPQIHRAGAATTATTSFEISRPSAMELSYLVAFDQKSGGLSLGGDGIRSAVVAEVELAAAESLGIDFDPVLTLLSDVAGTHTASVANGTLQVSGIANATPHPGTKRPGIHP